jgi:hypothetical protein
MHIIEPLQAFGVVFRVAYLKAHTVLQSCFNIAIALLKKVEAENLASLAWYR